MTNSVNNLKTANKKKDNEMKYFFRTTKKLSPYLLCIFAGPFKEIQEPNSRNLKQHSLYCRESMQKYLTQPFNQDEIFEVMDKTINFYSNYFGYPYPWGKHDFIFIPNFTTIGMENAGAMTFDESKCIFKSKPTEQ